MRASRSASAASPPVLAGDESAIQDRRRRGCRAGGDYRAKPFTGQRIADTFARMAIIECVPNISEGRRPDVVAGIVAAVRAVPGVRVLDSSSDASHNRSVLTL